MYTELLKAKEELRQADIRIRNANTACMNDSTMDRCRTLTRAVTLQLMSIDNTIEVALELAQGALMIPRHVMGSHEQSTLPPKPDGPK